MQTLHFSIEISAPKEKVWETMLNDQTYRQWTEVFSKESHYVGDWKAGSKILFLAPNKEGKMEGLISRIAENRPHDYISIEHLGEVKDGVEDVSSDEAQAWSGAHENYTFKSKGSGTKLIVDVDIVDNDETMQQMLDTWPRALQKLKTLAEV